MQLNLSLTHRRARGHRWADQPHLLRNPPATHITTCITTVSTGSKRTTPDASGWQQGSRLAWGFRAAPKVKAPSGTPPVVILPGFGNCTQDYAAGLGVPANSLVRSLQARGFSAHTVDIKRADWLKALQGIFTRSYWQQKSQPGKSYGWYLQKVQQAVNKARCETGHQQVILVGHSAGGWLGRAFMADPMYFESPSEDPGAPHQGVAHLVTLGTPHIAPAAELARDMTGGALSWVNRTYPGAYFAEAHGVQYTCVAGRTVRGNRKAKHSSLERYSHNSYAQVCGDGHEVEGDGVVPLASAVLQGATNVVLDGVYHSMSSVGSFSEPTGHVWYGSDSVVDHWLCHVVPNLTLA